MNKWTKVALIGGAAVVTIGAAIILTGGGGGASYSIKISAGEHGIVSGDNVGTLTFDVPTTIMIGPATPIAPYQFAGWIDENNQNVSKDATIQVTVDRPNMRRLAIFIEDVVIPSALTTKTLTPVTAKYRLQVWKTGYVNESGSYADDFFRMGARNDRLGDAFVDGELVFWLHDNAGNPCIGKSIAVYTEPSDTTLPFFKFLLYDYVTGIFRQTSQLSPVVYLTNTDGEVRPPVRVQWLPDSPETDYGLSNGSAYGPPGANDAQGIQIDHPLGIYMRNAVSPVRTEWEWSGLLMGVKWWGDWEYASHLHKSGYFVAYQNAAAHQVNAYWVDNDTKSAVASISGQFWMPAEQSLEVYRGDYMPHTDPIELWYNLTVDRNWTYEGYIDPVKGTYVKTANQMATVRCWHPTFDHWEFDDGAGGWVNVGKGRQQDGVDGWLADIMIDRDRQVRAITI